MENLPDTRSISLASSTYIWEDIEQRSKTLGLNRSKYTQMLYELDMKYNILSNYELLNRIKNPDKNKTRRIIDVVSLLLLMAILIVLLTTQMVI